jgi:hypothetical protein
MSSSRIHHVEIEYTNDQGDTVTGLFDYTLPSLRTRVAIGVEEAKLRSGMTADTLDEVTLAVIVQIAYLKHTVVFPDDLTFDDNVDPYLMSYLYEEVLSFESRFLDALNRPRADKTEV